MTTITFAAQMAQNMIRQIKHAVQAADVTILARQAKVGAKPCRIVFVRATWKPMAMATAALPVKYWMKIKIVQHHVLLKIAAHIHTLQTQGTLKNAKLAVTKARAINANPATSILVENAWNHRLQLQHQLQNVQMLPQLKIN